MGKRALRVDDLENRLRCNCQHFHRFEEMWKETETESIIAGWQEGILEFEDGGGTCNRVIWSPDK